MYIDFDNKIDAIRNNINDERKNYFGDITYDKEIKKKQPKPVDIEKVNESCKVFTDLDYKNKIVKKKSLIGNKRQNNTTLEELEELLTKKSEKILNRPWNKLEPKYKLDRFKQYVDSQQDWTSSEKKDAFNLLESCLQLNYLIKGTEVIYNIEEGLISKIKKLQVNTMDGKKEFSILTNNK